MTCALDSLVVGENQILVQVHDAFVIEELEYYELLGLCGNVMLIRNDVINGT